MLSNSFCRESNRRATLRLTATLSRSLGRRIANRGVNAIAFTPRFAMRLPSDLLRVAVNRNVARLFDSRQKLFDSIPAPAADLAYQLRAMSWLPVFNLEYACAVDDCRNILVVLGVVIS